MFELFSKFGKILEIYVGKKYALKGQAWIIFESEQSAVKALQGLSGYILYGRPLIIQYAKEKSEFFDKEAGTFVKRPKKIIPPPPPPGEARKHNYIILFSKRRTITGINNYFCRGKYQSH